jgi:hypothetical protein
MRDTTFVNELRDAVVNDALNEYANLLETIDPEAAKDPSWRILLSIYGNLGEARRKDLLVVLKLVMTDTVSHVLGILDGTSSIGGKLKPFKLFDESGDQLAGNLQDHFLDTDGV